MKPETINALFSKSSNPNSTHTVIRRNTRGEMRVATFGERHTAIEFALQRTLPHASRAYSAPCGVFIECENFTLHITETPMGRNHWSAVS